MASSFVWVQVYDGNQNKLGDVFMVSPGINVADFKEKVKEKMKPRLDSWAAAELLVYQNLETYINELGHPMEADVSLADLGKMANDPVVVVVPRPPPVAFTPQASSGKMI